MYIPLSLRHPYPRGNTQPSMPATQGGAEVCLQHSSIPPDNAATRGGRGEGSDPPEREQWQRLTYIIIHQEPQGMTR